MAALSAGLCAAETMIQYAAADACDLTLPWIPDWMAKS